MRLPVFLIFFLFLPDLVAQHDFNQDGFMDSINTLTLEFRDGKSGESFILRRNNNFAEFLDFIPIPRGVEEYPELMESMKSALFQNLEQSNPDPALNWLLSAYAHQTVLTDNPAFSVIFSPPISWHKWPPKFPSAKYMQVKTDTLILPHVILDQDELYIPEFDFGWLVYYGHNHRQVMDGVFHHEFKEILKTDTFSIYQSSHGLLLRKKDHYAWTFHSNASLTGGPGKLRWPSIHKVLLSNQFLFIHHVAPLSEINKIFVLSLKSGKAGLLKLPDLQTYQPINCFSLDLNDDKLLIRSGNNQNCHAGEENPESLVFDVDELTMALEAE